jgi:hypothetical protein
MIFKKLKVYLFKYNIVFYIIMEKKPKYKMRVKNVRDFPGARETTIKISRPNKLNHLDVWEMRSILANMQKNLPDTQFMVRAMNAQHMFTFKGYNDEDLNVEEFEDYYENKVSDPVKFKKFSFIEITSYVKLTPNAKSKVTKKGPNLKI